MGEALVDQQDVEVRLGRTLTATEAELVVTRIADVSEEVWSLVGEDAFHDAEQTLTVPGVVRAAVCDAVMRILENPRGLTGETIGDYNWQAAGARGSTGLLYLTAAERRTVRRAAGLPPVGTVTLQGDLPGASQFDINTLTWS